MAPPIDFVNNLPATRRADLPAEDQECVICFHEFQDDPSTGSSSLGEKNDDRVAEAAVRLPCSHLYGRECLRLWLDTHNTCPVCKTEVYPGHGASPDGVDVSFQRIDALLDRYERRRAAIDRVRDEVRISRNGGTLRGDPQHGTVSSNGYMSRLRNPGLSELVDGFENRRDDLILGVEDGANGPIRPHERRFIDSSAQMPDTGVQERPGLLSELRLAEQAGQGASNEAEAHHRQQRSTARSELQRNEAEAQGEGQNLVRESSIADAMRLRQEIYHHERAAQDLQFIQGRAALSSQPAPYRNHASTNPLRPRSGDQHYNTNQQQTSTSEQETFQRSQDRTRAPSTRLRAPRTVALEQVEARMQQVIEGATDVGPRSNALQERLNGMTQVIDRGGLLQPYPSTWFSNLPSDPGQTDRGTWRPAQTPSSTPAQGVAPIAARTKSHEPQTPQSGQTSRPESAESRQGRERLRLELLQRSADARYTAAVERLTSLRITGFLTTTLGTGQIPELISRTGIPQPEEALAEYQCAFTELQNAAAAVEGRQPPKNVFATNALRPTAAPTTVLPTGPEAATSTVAAPPPAPLLGRATPAQSNRSPEYGSMNRRQQRIHSPTPVKEPHPPPGSRAPVTIQRSRRRRSPVRYPELRLATDAPPSSSSSRSRGNDLASLRWEVEPETRRRLRELTGRDDVDPRGGVTSGFMGGSTVVEPDYRDSRFRRISWRNSGAR